MRLPSFVVLLAALVALAASQSLVLVGGALSDGNAPVWDKVVELAGGRGVAKIGVFTTASADPIGSADYYIDMFTRVYGAASATYIPVTETSNNANDPAIADLVRQQTGFFFGGGDQIRIIEALKPNGDTLVLTAVREIFAAGAVIGGTSAGLAALASTVVFAGGISYNALVTGSSTNPASSSDLSYDPRGGLGFLDGWVIDSHFSERGREGRLIRLLQDTRGLSIGATRGFGADEDTALVITGLPSQPIGTVIGTTGGVLFADVTNIVSQPVATTNYANVYTHYLTDEDSIDMTTGEITFPSWKPTMTGQEQQTNPVASQDILSSRASREWATSATGYFNSVIGGPVDNVSRERNPKFQVTFERAGAIGHGGRLPSDPLTFVISYKNLRVSIYEV